MPAARDDLRSPLTVRLTFDQDSAIRELADRTGQRNSDAMRDLLDEGILAVRRDRGIVLTREAHRLIPEGAVVRFVGPVAAMADELERLGFEQAADAARRECLLVCTGEEADAIDQLARSMAS